MDGNLETDTLRSICKETKKEGRLTGESMARLYKLFGQRFTKAFEVLRENRVKKYVFKPSSRTVWIVVGKERDYLLLPEAEFCSCKDFYFRVLDRKVHLCYHLVAQKMSNILKWYETIEESDELYEPLMDEWNKAST